MELLSVIRRWAFRDRLSIREISRRTGLSRNTIRKYLRSDVVEPAFKGPARSSKLDAFADKLSAWLKAEGSRPRKQKRTVKQLHADLVALGFDGSYGRVAAFARTWKTEETVQDVGGLSAISLGGPIGWSTGERDDQGRDDLPALFSPHILDGL
jgi:transposase